MKKNKHSLILSEHEKMELTNLLLSEHQYNQKPFGIYHLSHNHIAAPLAKHIEAFIFKESFNNDEVVMHCEYDIYDKASEYFIAIDHLKKQPAGVVRIIKHSEAGLKTLTDCGKPPWSCNVDKLIKENDIQYKLKNTYDVATLAVLSEYRKNNGQHISFNLYLTLVSFAKLNNIVKYTAILDQKAYSLLKKNGYLLNPLKGTEFAPYLGSANSVPTLLHADQFIQMIDEDHPSVTKIKLATIFMKRIVYFPAHLMPDHPGFKLYRNKMLALLIKILPIGLLTFIYRYKKSSMSHKRTLR